MNFINLIKKIFLNRKTTFIILLVLLITGLSLFGLIISGHKKGNTKKLSDKFFKNKEISSNYDKYNKGLSDNEDERKSLINQKTFNSNKKDKYLSKVVLSVKGLSCSSCVQDIKDALSNIKGISDILVDVANAKAQIYFDNRIIKDVNIIVDKITNNAGYPATILEILSPQKITKEKAYKDQKKSLYIASVNGWDITRSDYNIEVDALKKQYINKYGKEIFNTAKGEQLEERIKVQIISRLIDDAIILLDISKANYTVSEKTVENNIQDYLKKNSITYNDLVNNSDYPEEYFRKKIANSIMINHYLEDKIFSKTTSNNQKASLYNQWFSNIKTLANVVCYDTDLEQSIISVNSGIGGCCPQ